MTEKLYYENAYINEFSAKVISCEKVKKGYQVLLDKTAFFPEGGGQACDFGTLNNAKVIDVQEKEEKIYHLVSDELISGSTVTGHIDWERRFDLMQQHSGEHIVSGLIHNTYGYDNVGFHLGSDIITIDFNGEITETQMQEIEAKANALIWKNIKTEISFPTKEELETLPYRSKKELTGQVRIVRFPEADICACCGTHVAYTGEIGIVKLLSVQKFRDGVRMEMLCGRRVLSYMNQISEQNHQTSVLLSAKPEKTAEAVKRLWEENFRLKGRVASMEGIMFTNLAASYEKQGNVLHFEEGLESDSVRKLADQIMKVCGGRCAVFSKSTDGSFKYAIGEENGNLKDFTKEMNLALHGRGGGKPFFVQGSVNASEEEIRTFFQNL